MKLGGGRGSHSLWIMDLCRDMRDQEAGILFFDGIEEEEDGNEDDEDGDDAEDEPDQVGEAEQVQVAEEAVDGEDAEEELHEGDHEAGTLIRGGRD